MKNKFITKKKKRTFKLLFVFMMLCLGIIASYKNLEAKKITLKDKELIDLVVENSFSYEEENILDKFLSKTIELTNPINGLKKEYQKYIQTNYQEEPIMRENTDPLIYLYNTHQTEEYAPTSFAEFSVNPTVVISNYILQDLFQKNGYKSIVEEESISEILKQNSWNYSNSYKASRQLLEKKIIEYPSLKYFVDIHRDSLKKEKTTINISGKDYAKIMFIVGLENPSYQANLELTEKINNKLVDLYPNISKGIYKKGGIGVNGVYNQDFSGNTILIEIGGFENTTSEVLNSALAFGKCFLEVINE